MAYLYRHIRLDKNEPFYIGIGSDSSYKRAFNKKYRNKFWLKIVDKTDYRVEILFDNLNWGEACEKEKEFIDIYGRRDLNTGTLCNLTNGGEGVSGLIRSYETRLKMSKSRKGVKKRPLSDEHRKKISNSKKGNFTCGDNPYSRMVINTETGELFSSIIEASKCTKINYNTLYGYLSGKKKNKTNLKFIH